MQANEVAPDPSDRRRSTRVLVKIPLRIRGTGTAGSELDTGAETLLVNKHGAKVRSQHPLELGMEVAVAVQATSRSQSARVVWEDQPGANIYGIEFVSPENLWGITFPPEDWGFGNQPAEISKEVSSC
ncbi:MAG: PilZ domain-containing protein [Candidatus Korobacteraceae bacterium]